MNITWTGERTEVLKKLWDQGLSASQIAKQLGGVSRNSVIGKVRRLKLSSRGRASLSPARSKKFKKPSNPTLQEAMKIAQVTSKTPTSSPVQALVPPKKIEETKTRSLDTVVPISRNIILVELKEHNCKWPNGDPLTEDFSFCGNESMEHGPYCRFHAKIAFQPASERRRLR